MLLGVLRFLCDAPSDECGLTCWSASCSHCIASSMVRKRVSSNGCVLKSLTYKISSSSAKLIALKLISEIVG